LGLGLPSSRLRPDRAALSLIALFLLGRLVLAATLDFTVDESYTIANARHLALSYFDHPPAQSWIVHAFMPLLGEGHAIRLPFILLFAGSSWLLFDLTRQLFSGEAGVWSVLTLNLSVFFTASAGTLVVPDGPLLFCLLAAALVIARGLFPAVHPPSPWRTWLLAGLWIGLAGLSKYHAILFALGVLCFFASIPARRAVFLHPAPYAGALLALAILSPVLIWNTEHNWASFAYQGVNSLPRASLHLSNFILNLAGQAVWIFPWIFAPLVVSAWYALRAGRKREQAWYCLCLALPTIAIFSAEPLWGDRGLPHWPMPGWLMLYPVLGDFLAQRARNPHVRRWAIASTALLIGLSIMIVGHTATGIGRVLLPSLLGARDPTLEAFEWTPLRTDLQARGLLEDKGLFVIAPNWIDAGRIDQALKGLLPVVIIGNDPKNFGFLYDPKAFVGHDALIIGQDISDDQLTLARSYFDAVTEAAPVEFGRSGMNEIRLRVLQAKLLQRPLPSRYH